jgi:CRISPR/Cas system CSM-associated protein Csm3 (group 7 of RAMP superfamily)
MPKDNDFLNPYRMLKQPGGSPDRHYATDRSSLAGYGGRLDCVLTTHTPLEVNYKPNHVFSTAPLIPGSSLKGIVRSVAEFVGRGCVSVRSDPRREGDWALCAGPRACITCDMFGRLVQGGRALHKGKVSLDDALPEAFRKHPALRLLQGTPKETHTAFYPQSSDGTWRKFYFHHVKAADELRIDDRPIGGFAPATLNPVASGSRFRFRVDFEQLDARQVALLIYALELEPGMLHKLGRGKGRGLGSVKIAVTIVRIEDAAARLRGRAEAGVPAPVQQALKALRNDPALEDFRWMLDWGAAGVLPPIRYPSYQWFREPGNSQRKLRTVAEVFQGLARVTADPDARALASETRAPAPVIASGTERWGPVALVFDPGRNELKVAHQNRTAFARGDAAKRVRDGLPPELAERLTKRRELKGVFVRVTISGNQIDLSAVEPGG